MNMEIILHYCSPPLASVWWGGGCKHARPVGLSALLAATSAGLSTVNSDFSDTAAVRRTTTSLLIGSSNQLF